MSASSKQTFKYRVPKEGVGQKLTLRSFIIGGLQKGLKILLKKDYLQINILMGKLKWHNDL